MHVIIETGGKQYKVTEGDTLFIEKLEAERPGDRVRPGAGHSGRRQRHFRRSRVEGASVSATVVKNGKGKKVRVSSTTQEGLPQASGPSSALHQGADRRHQGLIYDHRNIPNRGTPDHGLHRQWSQRYASEGEDIVCAAVTSAVRLVECAVNDVLGLELQ